MNIHPFPNRQARQAPAPAEISIAESPAAGNNARLAAWQTKKQAGTAVPA